MLCLTLYDLSTKTMSACMPGEDSVAIWFETDFQKRG